MKNQLILGDNLEVLRDIPSDSVDLIYVDPPFFSNRHYEVIWGDEGEIASFNDRWAGGINHYIEWLYKRVEQLYRVLKPTGSFYLHCDWHANAYIRVYILDRIFGDKNFVNEIIWRYSSGGASKHFYSRNHDTIFFYTKTSNYLFNSDRIRIERTPKSLNRIKNPKGARTILENKLPEDVFEIQILNPMSKERIGYPTQKPEALLERIIKASSNPGDIVLDAFCGGGTTPAVARRLGRKFIGIDQSVRAIAVSNARLEKQTDLFVDDVYEVRTKAYDYEKLRKMPPFEFESWIIEMFGGVPNVKQRGDGGKDGIIRVDGISLPIQVKQQNNVGRPQLQNFVGYLIQNNQNKGFFIAFDFAKTAYEYAAEIKQNSGIDIELVPVDQIIHIAKKSNIDLDWSYKTINNEQIVSLVATGDNIILWQWDFDYQEEKGFVASILKDVDGRQSMTMTAGKHVIAVRGIDKEGVESIETITLYSNGSVHE